MMRLIPVVCYSSTNTDGKGSIMDSEWEYQVRVEGKIGQRWLAWFDGLTISTKEEHAGGAGGRPAITTLTGFLPDEAALAGLLQKLYTLGLPLLEVRRSDAGCADSAICDWEMSGIGMSIRKADGEWRRGGQEQDV
jgi:hypothetical protein